MTDVKLINHDIFAALPCVSSILVVEYCVGNNKSVYVMLNVMDGIGVVSYILFFKVFFCLFSVQHCDS